MEIESLRPLHYLAILEHLSSVKGSPAGHFFNKALLSKLLFPFLFLKGGKKFVKPQNCRLWLAPSENEAHRYGGKEANRIEYGHNESNLTTKSSL